MADTTKPSPSPSTSSKPGCLRRLSNAVDRTLQRGFGALGRGVARCPWVTLVICFIVIFACAAGMSQTKTETRGEIVWTPDNSDAGERLDQIVSVYGNGPRQSSILIRTKPAGGNVLTGAALSAAAQLSQRVWAVTANASYMAEPSQRWTWDDLCARIGGKCWYTSLLDAWQYNVTTIQAAAAAPGGIPQDLIRLEREGRLLDIYGRPLDLNNILGGIQRNAAGNITFASTMRISFALINRQYEEGGTNVDPPAQEWERAVVDTIGRTAAEQGLTDIIALPRLVTPENDEVSSNIRGDLAFVSGAIVIIMVYLVAQLGKCSRIHSRVAAAFGALATVGGALIVSYGLGALLTFQSSVHQVLPFLIAGIGVDDIFVLTREFDLAKKKLDEGHTNAAIRPKSRERDVEAGGEGTGAGAGTSRVHPQPEEGACNCCTGPSGDDIVARTEHALAMGGSSMLATTATDVIAFSISATTVLPALSWFCVWAAIAVLAVFVLTCTMYTAILVIDSRRQRSRLMDCLCCFRVGRKRAEAEEPEEYNATAAADEARGCCCCCARPKLMERFLEHAYMKTIMRTPVKVVVILMFLVVLAISAVGVSQLKQEFRREWFLPQDSYVQEHYAVSRAEFSQLGVSVSVYIANVEDPFESRAALGSAITVLQDSSFIDRSLPFTDWYSDFELYMQATSRDINTKADFDAGLAQFFALPQYARYARDVKFVEGSSTKIRMCRVSGYFVAMTEATAEVEAMQGVKAETEAWAAKNGVADKAFAFSFAFTGWALVEVTQGEAVQNIGLALLAVFVVSAVLLAHVGMAVVLVLMIASVLVCILGLMTFWDVPLEAVAVTQLVLSVGLAVDYSLHIAHSFLHKSGTRNERATLAVVEMGISVLNGAISTFLAIALLGFSNSFIFVTFFKMFFLSCVLGAAHGLLLLPVLLSIFGPQEFDHDTSGEEGQKASPAPQQQDDAAAEGVQMVEVNASS